MVIERGSHPFPFRTRQLSLSSPMILRGQLRGKVGRRRDKIYKGPRGDSRAFSFAGLVRVYSSKSNCSERSPSRTWSRGTAPPVDSRSEAAGRARKALSPDRPRTPARSPGSRPAASPATSASQQDPPAALRPASGLLWTSPSMPVRGHRGSSRTHCGQSTAAASCTKHRRNEHLPAGNDRIGLCFAPPWFMNGNPVVTTAR